MSKGMYQLYSKYCFQRGKKMGRRREGGKERDLSMNFRMEFSNFSTNLPTFFGIS